ncbi:hypothetical protein NDU88_000085 [Pleurodeles waltl]|uniref:Uncharacterized protein n=1 Tax=Pleurodeles waltl TaxID=8319 RepID=A0AAV7KVA8_PLEWA|nr:hypothetical protein NDU88_000085 [Pleurodeles waltl]
MPHMDEVFGRDVQHKGSAFTKHLEENCGGGDGSLVDREQGAGSFFEADLSVDSKSEDTPPTESIEGEDPLLTMIQIYLDVHGKMVVASNTLQEQKKENNIFKEKNTTLKQKIVKKEANNKKLKQKVSRCALFSYEHVIVK